ncbi:MAG: hypothetical protein Q8Q89_00950 [bacterium]|nr:hypothetical protein [bacterium]
MTENSSSFKPNFERLAKTAGVLLETAYDAVNTGEETIVNTALATQQTSMNEQSLILPNKREALLMRLNEFKTNNLSARDLEDYKILTLKTSILFTLLCWSKLGVSSEQLKKLNQQDLNELAAIIYEQSRIFAFVQTGILACIPLIGWIILLVTSVDPSIMPNGSSSFYRNMRYCRWYRRMKNRYGQDFEPSLAKVSE